MSNWNAADMQSSPGSHREPGAQLVPCWEELREEWHHQPEDADSVTKLRLECMSDFFLTLLVPHLSKRDKKWEMFSEFLVEIQDERAYIRSPTNKTERGRWYIDFFQLVNLITINSYQVISLKVRFISVRAQNQVLLNCSPGPEKRHFIHQKCYAFDI